MLTGALGASQINSQAPWKERVRGRRNDRRRRGARLTRGRLSRRNGRGPGGVPCIAIDVARGLESLLRLELLADVCTCVVVRGGERDVPPSAFHLPLPKLNCLSSAPRLERALEWWRHRCRTPKVVGRQ